MLKIIYIFITVLTVSHIARAPNIGSRRYEITVSCGTVLSMMYVYDVATGLSKQNKTSTEYMKI